MMIIVFITTVFKVCDTVLAEFGRAFFFVLPLFLIFVFVCQILGSKRSQWPIIDIQRNLVIDIGTQLIVLMTF